VLARRRDGAGEREDLRRRGDVIRLSGQQVDRALDPFEVDALARDGQLTADQREVSK
jgi:hypothetical protein